MICIGLIGGFGLNCSLIVILFVLIFMMLSGFVVICSWCVLMSVCVCGGSLLKWLISFFWMLLIVLLCL